HFVEEVSKAGGKALAIQADFAQVGAALAVESVVKEFGRLDVLVNNAGLTRDTLVMRMSEADWDVVMETNLKAAFLASKAGLRPSSWNGHGTPPPFRGSAPPLTWPRRSFFSPLLRPGTLPARSWALTAVCQFRTMTAASTRI